MFPGGRALATTGCLLCGVLVTAAAAAPPASFDPQYEARQYAKTQERAAFDYTPAFDAQLAAVGAQNEFEGDQILAGDGPAATYGRDPTGNLCFHHQNGCAGDIRLYGWGNGAGVVIPVLFTARNGSTLSGHVWMTRSGPAVRPGIVFTNGSIQAPEPLYWFAAQALAKDGYIVLTYDPQGQGYSDTYGEGADRNDGVPSQQGEPFFDGTEDALDFFLSTPQNPYQPRPSCSSGTSHVDKQTARVKAGLDSAYNPLWRYLDTARVGLAGHSLGATGVSYVGQLDPRVKAIVAFDDLLDVTKPGSLSNFGQTITCASGSSRRPSPIRVSKPALGLSDDYGLAPQPFTSLPDPAAKLGPSRSLSAAHVDSGEIVIRGGTHYEFSYIPNQAFGATHRGMDMATWYLLAWFDLHLKGDRAAAARLETNRWCDDAAERAVDDQSPPDGNMFSVYYTSRLELQGRAGRAFDAEDLRAACSTRGALSPDPGPANFSFLSYDTAPDRPGPGAPSPGIPSTTRPAGADGAPPGARGPRAMVCPVARGALTGNTLGPVRLGMGRAGLLRRFPHHTTRGRHDMVFLCFYPRGIRAGFPGADELAALPARARRSLRDRVVMLLTANEHYSAGGVVPGDGLATAARRLRLSRAYRIGRNTWYLASLGRARIVLKVVGGVVQEVGVADASLTVPRLARRFLADFR